jgi:cob(I)alamin adenosyltransferase
VPQGQPSVVPDDGLTTRARRDRPLLIVHTGDGKGKSTAAFGLALRGWAQGWPVGVFQFVKSAKWRIGEQRALTTLAATGEGGGITWHKMGDGWSWLPRHSDPRHADPAADPAGAAREGWAQIQRDLAAEAYRLYVLDELTYPLQWGWIDTDEVLDTLARRPGRQHVVITGRRAPAALVDAADLVTEMTKIKHPMDAGQKGQRGIEW